MKGLNVMNKCFKRIIASAMSVVTALSVTCTPIYAYSEKAISDEQYVMLQANRLMNSVNMDTLKEATKTVSLITPFQPLSETVSAQMQNLFL